MHRSLISDLLRFAFLAESTSAADISQSSEKNGVAHTIRLLKVLISS